MGKFYIFQRCNNFVMQKRTKSKKKEEVGKSSYVAAKNQATYFLFPIEERCIFLFCKFKEVKQGCFL